MNKKDYLIRLWSHLCFEKYVRSDLYAIEYFEEPGREDKIKIRKRIENSHFMTIEIVQLAHAFFVKFTNLIDGVVIVNEITDEEIRSNGKIRE